MNRKRQKDDGQHAEMASMIDEVIQARQAFEQARIEARKQDAKIRSDTAEEANDDQLQLPLRQAFEQARIDAA